MSGEKLSEFKDKIEALKSWRDPDDEMLPSKEILKGLLTISTEAATCHSAYSHYTTVKAFKKIFDGKDGPSLRLSRLASVTLNDRNESDKYIRPELAKQTFVSCFNHDGSECANLWWLYAKGSPDALRITFPARPFEAWCAELRKQGAFVADVLYAAVKGEKDDYAFSRRNTLSWEDQRIGVKDFHALLGNPELAGRVKDYEWRAERETRIIIRKGTGDRFVYLPLPDWLIGEMRITTSPWVTDVDYERIKRIVCDCLKERWKCTKNTFRPSVLERSMDALKRSR